MNRQKDIDGGWAYVVGFGVFISFFIIAGFARSFGILYAAFIDTFGESDSVTSLLVGVRSACAILSGPMGTALSERFTERKVVIAGALITSSGFCLSYFATNLQFLIISIGALQGIGTTIIIGPSMVCMGNYFVKKRSRAVTLTSCGGCIGMMVVPILLQQLVDVYSVRGALLIFGGLALHLLLTGAFLRPLKADDSEGPCDQGTRSSILKNPQFDKNCDVAVGCDIQYAEKVVENEESEKFCMEVTPSDFQTPEKMAIVKSEMSPEPEVETSRLTESKDGHAEICELKDRELPNGTVAQKDPEVSRKRVRRTFRSVVIQSFNFSLCRNPLFVIILTSASLSAIPYVTMTMFLVPLLGSHGISRDMAAILLSVMGGCDIVGRLVCGALADKKPIEPKHVIFVTSILGGILCSVLAVLSDFYGFLGLLIPYGLIASTPNILIMPATIKYVGLDLLPQAVGMIMFFLGISTAVAPPLLGMLKDKTGSYEAIFPVLGSIHIFAAIVFLLEPLARRWLRRKRREPAGD